MAKQDYKTLVHKTHLLDQLIPLHQMMLLLVDLEKWLSMPQVTDHCWLHLGHQKSEGNFILHTWHVLVTIHEKLINKFTHIDVCPAEGRERIHPAGKWQYALLVPGRRASTIKLTLFQNPIYSIVHKIAGCEIWRQNLAWYESLTN